MRGRAGAQSFSHTYDRLAIRLGCAVVCGVLCRAVRFQGNFPVGCLTLLKMHLNETANVTCNKLHFQPKFDRQHLTQTQNFAKMHNFHKFPNTQSRAIRRKGSNDYGKR